MPVKKKTKKTIKKTIKKTARKKTQKVSDSKKSEMVKDIPLEELVDCSHCDGTGKCAAGEPYDKMHHQGIFTQKRLTSCFECLEAAGEKRNSKKMVNCRFCNGTGKVKKPAIS